MTSPVFRLFVPAALCLCGAVSLRADMPAVTSPIAGTAPALPTSAKLPDPVVYSPAVVPSGTSEQIAAIVRAVLARTDPLDRIAGEAEVLKQMAPENAEAVLQAYQRDTSLKRSYGIETGQVYLRVGQVMGSKLLLTKLPQQPTGTLAVTSALQIEGWASRQPAEAVEWFKTWPRWKSRGAVALAVTKGLATADVALAEAFMNDGDADVRLQVVPAYFSLLHAQGDFSKALQWAERNLVAKREEALPGGEEAVRKALFSRMMNPVTANLGTVALREFLARHSLATYATDVHDFQKIMQELGRRDPVGTLDWMPTVALATVPDGNPAAFWQFTWAWLDEGEEEVVKWMASKPDHPLRDYVVWVYSQRLTKLSRKDEARTLIGSMKNEKLRTKALAQVRPDTILHSNV